MKIETWVKQFTVVTIPTRGATTWLSALAEWLDAPTRAKFRQTCTSLHAQPWPQQMKVLLRQLRCVCGMQASSHCCDRLWCVMHPCPHPMAVEVKPSKIPHAGNGLFARCAFKRGQDVVKDAYKQMTEAQYEESPNSDYILDDNTVKPRQLLDLRGSLLGYANSLPRTDRRCNVYFRRVGVYYALRARRRVEIGDELIVDYGCHFEWPSSS
jgi:hypothetical protein